MQGKTGSGENGVFGTLILIYFESSLFESNIVSPIIYYMKRSLSNCDCFSCQTFRLHFRTSRKLRDKLNLSVVLKSSKVSECKNMLSITTKNIVQSVWEEECNISHIFTVLLGQAFKNLKGYDLFKEIISLHIFKRLSSTNFTWSIFEYFVSFKCCSVWWGAFHRRILKPY